MSTPFESPWARWLRDPRPLAHVTEEELRRAFVSYLWRTVSKDRLVPIDGLDYELPRDLGSNGRMGTKVQVVYRLLEGTYHVIGKDGKLVRICPVDLAENARSTRAPRDASGDELAAPYTYTAADMALEQDLGPIIDDVGNALSSASADEPDDPPWIE